MIFFHFGIDTGTTKIENPRKRDTSLGGLKRSAHAGMTAKRKII